ncbi:hypothetical protein [Jeotgalicoccus sp. WY2]|uniref:hypothetical protein n=1 Tax=Jeotgalicoccus sp. WY2 TaxID=2708346 RepID=UPI00201FD79D|nr:hypothetical protein [Jeotgalicoccus sp. WY2]
MDIKSFFEQYKFYVIGGIAAVIILVYFLITSIQEPVESLAFDSGSAEPEVEEPVEVSVPAATVFVEVKGAVSTPGVYELPSDARVKNVLDIAVLSDKADLMTVNQSAKLLMKWLFIFLMKAKLMRLLYWIWLKAEQGHLMLPINWLI